MTCLAFLSSCKMDQKSKPEDDNSKVGKKEVVETYVSGETSRTYTRIDGKIEGKMTDFYPSGKLKGERFFKNDLQDGKTTIYYESGSIKEVQYYISGKRNYGDTIFYENGQLKYISEFKDNVKNGYLRSFQEDGTVIYEAKFLMDSLIEVGGQAIGNK